MDDRSLIGGTKKIYRQDPTTHNDKEKVIKDLTFSIEELEIRYFKQRLLKDEEWDAEALSGLQKALDLVLTLQPSAYLKKINFQHDGKSCHFGGRVVLHDVVWDVVWVTEKWECMLFRHAILCEIRSGILQCTSFIEDNILDPCVIIQRWWKNILCRRRARVTIQRWWRKILYQPKYFFKTSMFSKAKRNFDTSLKRTMDIAKTPADESAENRDHHQEPPTEPPPSPSLQLAEPRGAM
nr:MAG: hypothetical protein [Sesarmops intermedium nimavirus]